MTLSHLKFALGATAFLGAASVLASCGTVPAEWQEEGPRTAAFSGDPDEEVCKDTRMTGSSFNKTLCMTREEWAMVEEKSKANAKRIQDGSARAIRSTGGGG